MQSFYVDNLKILICFFTVYGSLNARSLPLRMAHDSSGLYEQ